MFLKKLFFASASVLMLALAYHLGAATATAQGQTGNPVVAAFESGSNTNFVVTANGDIYTSGPFAGNVWSKQPNIFSGAPTSARSESFGALKAKYR